MKNKFVLMIMVMTTKFKMDKMMMMTVEVVVAVKNKPAAILCKPWREPNKFSCTTNCQVMGLWMDARGKKCKYKKPTHIHKSLYDFDYIILLLILNALYFMFAEYGTSTNAPNADNALH